MTWTHAEVGRKGARAVRWREQPCPVTHPTIPVTCEKKQKWAGDNWPGHKQHMWRGELGGCRTEIAWFAEPDEPNTDSRHAR